MTSEASKPTISPRIDLGQAQERWPDEVFAPLGGAVFHCITKRYAVPSTYCEALCGAHGFVPGLEFEALLNDSICMRCQRRMERWS